MTRCPPKTESPECFRESGDACASSDSRSARTSDASKVRRNASSRA